MAASLANLADTPLDSRSQAAGGGSKAGHFVAFNLMPFSYSQSSTLYGECMDGFDRCTPS